MSVLLSFLVWRSCPLDSALIRLIQADAQRLGSGDAGAVAGAGAKHSHGLDEDVGVVAKFAGDGEATVAVVSVGPISVCIAGTHSSAEHMRGAEDRKMLDLREFHVR